MNVKESSGRVGAVFSTAFGYARRLVAPSPPRLAVQTIRHNIAITRRETLAFWLLSEVDYDGFSGRERNEHQGEWAQRLAELGDNAARLYLYGGHEWFPRDGYVRAMQANYPDALAGFEEDLEDAASYMANFVRPTGGRYRARAGSSKPYVVAAVPVADWAIKPEHVSHVLAEDNAPDRLGRVEQVRERYRTIGAILGSLGATPLDEAGLELLIASRRAAGHVVTMDDITTPPAPAGGQPVDLADTDLEGWERIVVSHWPDDDATTAHVRVDRDGDRTDRYVRTLRATHWRPRESTIVPPWIPAVLNHPSAPDVTVCLDLVAGDDLAKGQTARAWQVEQNVLHKMEHSENATPTDKEAAATAETIVDELSSADARRANRGVGVVLVHVSGETPSEALEAARAVQSAMSDGGGTSASGPGMTLKAVGEQWSEYWGAIPGHVPAGDFRGIPVGEVTQQSCDFIATSVPDASLHAGDPIGVPIGNIGGTNESMLFDLLGGSSSNRSNVVGCIGDQGSGKTSLGSLLVRAAVRSGMRTVVADPSGGMAKLAAMPSIKDVSTVLKVGSTTPGILAPHYLIAEPRRDLYDTPEEYDDAVREAEAARVDAAIGMVTMIPKLLDPGTEAAGARAARNGIGKLGGAYGTHPQRIIDAIEAEGGAGVEVAAALREYARLPEGRVFFEAPDEALYAENDGTLLTVITTEGIEPPPSSDKPLSDWTPAQLRSRPVQYLVTLLGARNIWLDREPKAYFADELTGAIGLGNEQYTRFLNRVATDSRKFAALVFLMMHTSQTWDRIDSGFLSLLGAAFVGRTEEQNAIGSLPALRVKAGLGWEEAVQQLRTGEFIVRTFGDAERKGAVRQVIVDQQWWPQELIDATSNTPVTPRERVRAGVGHW